MDNVRVLLGRASEPGISSSSTPTGSIGSVSGVTAFSELGSGIGDVAEGRLSLLMLDTLVLAFIVFYVWTRKVQAAA